MSPLYLFHNTFRAFPKMQFCLYLNRYSLIWICLILPLAFSLTPMSSTFTSGENYNDDIPTFPLGMVDNKTTISLFMSLSAGTQDANDKLSLAPISYICPSNYPTGTTVTTSCDSTQNAYNSSCTVLFAPALSDTQNCSVRIAPGVINVDGPYPNSLLLLRIVILKNGTLLSQNSDILRSQYSKIVYLSTAQPAYTTTISPTTSQIYMYSLNMTTLVVSQLPNVDGGSIGTPDSSVSNVLKTTFNLPAGYYLLQTYSTPGTTYTFTYSTDQYPCPYEPAYVDVHNIFAGCVQKDQSPNGLPCVSYDSFNFVCLKCMDGYRVMNGRCIQNAVSCGPMQYYHYNSCVNVSNLCGSFNIANGNCLSCVNSTFYLQNGVCKSITCQNGILLNNGICANTPPNCLSIDLNTAQCVGCSTGYQLVAAICIPAPVPCGVRQYITNGKCTDIDSNCILFDQSGCLKCTRGYYLQNRVCIQFNCPPNTYPSQYGMFCLQVSPLCLTFNSLGECLSCISGYSLSDGGICLQTVGIVNCRDRGQLGFGKCNETCLSIDINTGNCITCISGYSLDENGNCMNHTRGCTSRQYSVNGFCYDVNPLCLTFNPNNGNCLTCTNGQLPYLGACTGGCQVNQYIDQNGFCQTINPRCASINPTTGYCLSCLNPTDTLNNGVCCAAGTIFVNNACNIIVSAPNPVLTSTTTDPNCGRYHPSLGYCLSCMEGFNLSSAMYGKCIKS